MPTPDTPSALAGIRILDLSRILAGPYCTQLLGDLGAEVIKVERPGHGDDTRKWGPPYLQDTQGEALAESAYYLSCNRNKRSLTIDISRTEGQALIYKLLENTDVFIENYKVGDMKKYHLAYEQLIARYPQLVYCSISGFGQDGPDANRPGYDFMIQAMGGIMSATGPVEGKPYKTGVGIADMMCGMYAANAIQAALLYRERSGKGQYIDCALFDTQLAWLANNGLNYLTSGRESARYGNGHPNIVPYDVYPCEDQYLALAIGNDAQFERFCAVAGIPEIAKNSRFAVNENRVANREALNPIIEKATKSKPLQFWLEKLTNNNVPCGPVNTVRQAFAEPQAKHRGMRLSMPHPTTKNHQVDLIANPLKFSKTPVNYQRHPPSLGEHTEEILCKELGLDESTIKTLKSKSIV